MSIFKKAYVRGCAQLLIEEGILKVSADQGAAMADQVGGQLTPEPSAGQLPPEATQEVLEALVELAKQHEGAGDMGGEVPLGAEQAAPKVAGDTGSVITGYNAEQGNEERNTTQGDAKMDLASRPESSYANVGVRGVGKSDRANKGRIGEEDKEGGPAHSEAKKNTVNSGAEGKSASLDLNALVRKLAADTGSVITGKKPEQENKEVKTPQGDAKMDLASRPESTYANKGVRGVGKSDMANEGHIGEEKEVGDGVHTESVKNTVNSKAAAFNTLFEATAQEWVGKLPEVLGDEEKVAAVKHLMILDSDEQAIFVEKLAEESEKLKELAEDEKAHHGHIPSKAEEHAEMKKHEDKGKKEEKKDEKKEASEKCEHCDKGPCECSEEDKEKRKEKSEKKAEAAQTKEGRLLRRYVDPYGYKNDKSALPKDAYGYKGGQKQASDILSKLASLTRK